MGVSRPRDLRRMAGAALSKFELAKRTGKGSAESESWGFVFFCYLMQRLADYFEKLCWSDAL